VQRLQTLPREPPSYLKGKPTSPSGRLQACEGRLTVEKTVNIWGNLPRNGGTGAPSLLEAPTEHIPPHVDGKGTKSLPAATGRPASRGGASFGNKSDEKNRRARKKGRIVARADKKCATVSCHGRPRNEGAGRGRGGAGRGRTSQNLAPIWLPHWPPWMWTISRMLLLLVCTQRAGALLLLDSTPSTGVEPEIKVQRGGSARSLFEGPGMCGPGYAGPRFLAVLSGSRDARTRKARCSPGTPERVPGRRSCTNGLSEPLMTPHDVEMTREGAPSSKGREDLLTLLARRVLYPGEGDGVCAPRMTISKERHVKDVVSRFVGSIAPGEGEAQGRPPSLDVPAVGEAGRRANVERGILARCLELHREGRSDAADALEDGVEAFRCAGHSGPPAQSPPGPSPPPSRSLGTLARSRPSPPPLPARPAGSARAAPSRASPPTRRSDPSP